MTERVVLSGATLVDGTGREPRSDMTVVLEDEIIAGSDSNNTLRFGSHAGEIELLPTEIGLTPMEALVAATSAAPDALGLGDRTGTVAPGRWADLLVVDGDPLSDLGLLRDRGRLRAVFQSGRAYTPKRPGRGVHTEHTEHPGRAGGPPRP